MIKPRRVYKESKCPCHNCAACPCLWLFCVPMSMQFVQVHGVQVYNACPGHAACSGSRWMFRSMPILHVHDQVHVIIPCLFCMSMLMPMLHVHVQDNYAKLSVLYSTLFSFSLRTTHPLPFLRKKDSTITSLDLDAEWKMRKESAVFGTYFLQPHKRKSENGVI